MKHIYHQGQVVRKPVNINPGLNVNWSVMFSCFETFFTSNVWYSLRLLQQGKQDKQNTSPKSFKTAIKIIANPGLA